jgi:methionyl-tRNA formyltransferase
VRTAYLGTSDFAATVLRRLAGSDHAPALVVTPPDSKRGRGRKLSPPPAADAARELGIELFQAPNVNADDARARIEAAKPSAVVVCAFGQLISEPLLSDWEMLNVHPSLLPRWRGAAPIERAIIAGDERTGVTIMRVDAGLDSGPIALQEATAIGADEHYDALEARLAELSAKLLIEALDRLAAGTLELTEQAEDEATYAEKIDAAERRLDPARPAVELARIVRALNPHIGTYLELEGEERLGVRAAKPLDDGPAQGAIAAVDGRPVLGTADGGLRLDVLQAPGGKPLAAAEFLRGNELPETVL